MTKRDQERLVKASLGRGRKLATGLAITAVLGGGVWWIQSDMSPVGGVLSGLHKRADAYRFAWPRGHVYTYGVTWSASQENRLMEEQQGGSAQAAVVSGALSTRADLVVRSYGNLGSRTVLGLSVANIAELSWTLLGQDVVKEAAETFDGRQAYVEIDATGRIHRAYFDSDAPTEFRGFVQWLLPSLQVSLSRTQAEWDASAWSAEEETLQGRVSVSYTRESDGPLSLRRERARYSSLRMAAVDGVKQEGRDVASVRCADEGHLEALSGELSLRVSNASGTLLSLQEKLEVSLKSVSRETPRPMPHLAGASFSGYALAEAPGADSAEQRAMINRVGDLTIGDMVSHVLDFANAGRMDNRWLWQATGLLQLHPEAAAELARVFEHEDLSKMGRAMILDLLASAGTKEAQKALREVLDSPSAKEDATTHAVYYNRIALTDADEETAAFAVEQFEAHANDEVGPMRIATAYALGAVAEKRYAAGDKRGVEALNARLVEQLGGASEPAEKTVAIRAMGNAGLEENVDRLVQQTKDASTEVRAAAADALRKNHTAESTEALLTLLQDPEWEVQQSALTSLSRYSLSVAEVTRIEELLVAGVVGSRNDPLVVSVLAKNASPENPYAAGFSVLLARNQQNGQLAARIRAIGRRNGLTF